MGVSDMRAYRTEVRKKMNAHYEHYGSRLAAMMRRAARLEGMDSVCGRVGISVHRFRDIGNPNRLTNSGNPVPCPTDLGVRATVLLNDFEWLDSVVRDCGCLIVRPDDLAAVRDRDPVGSVRAALRVIEGVGYAYGEAA